MSTSGSRTAVAEQSGAKSQLAGLVGAGTVALLLLFLNSLLADLPQTALAAVVIAAALSLMDLAAVRRYWRVRRTRLTSPSWRPPASSSSACCEGIVVAIALSILHLLPPQLVAARRGAREGRRAGGWHSVDDRDGAEEVPGIVVFRWEAPLFFANSGLFREQLRRSCARSSAALGRAAVRGDHRRRRHRRRDARAARQAAQRARASTSPSSSCAARLHDLILRYGLFETLDRDHFYPSIEEAIAAIAASDAADDIAGQPRGDEPDGGPG